MLPIIKKHCNKQSVVYLKAEISFSTNASQWGETQIKQLNGLSEGKTDP